MRVRTGPRCRALWGSFLTIGAILTSAAPAIAGDTAAADALFKEALALLDQGKWSEACPKFQASWDFDPSVSTLINLGRCRQQEGKLAGALGLLADAAKMNREARDNGRKEQLAAYIDKLTADLEPRVPRVTVTVSGPAPAELSLTRDGAPMPQSALGQALPLDPGEHVIVVRAPGFQEKSISFTLKEGQRSEIPVTMEKSTAVAPIRPPRNVPPPLPPDGAREPAATGMSGQSIAGISLIAAGGAGLVVGGVLAGLAGAKAGEVPTSCEQDGYTCASDADRDLANDASQSGQTFLTGGIVGFAAGAALLATGAIVFATDGRERVALIPWAGKSIAGGELIARW